MTAAVDQGRPQPVAGDARAEARDPAEPAARAPSAGGEQAARSEPAAGQEVDTSEREDDAASADEAAGYSLPEDAIKSYYRASDSTFSGPTVFGAGGLSMGFYIDAGQSRRSEGFETYPIPGGLVGEGRETYALTPSDEELRERLATQCVIYINGAVGSGVPTAAMVALAVRHGDDKVAGIRLIDGGLTRALNEPDLLLDGFGHVLEVDDRVELARHHLEMFESKAHHGGVSLIVVSRSDGPDDFSRYRVRHVAPDPTEVFDRWLRYELRRLNRCVGGCSPCVAGCHRVYIDRCLSDPGVIGRLSDADGLTEVVELAKHCARDEPESLPEGYARLRRRASDALKVDSDVVGGRQTARHMQAFRIAYALLHDVSVTHVFSAVGALVDKLDRAQGRLPRGRPVLERDVNQLLGGDLQDLDENDLRGGGMANRARLRTPRLAGAILDVAWNDYDSLREPLLAWVRELGYDRHAAIRWYVAAATGRLCGYDFEGLTDQVIDVWTRVRDAGYRDARQTAAFALESAAYNEHLRPSVLRYVRGLVFDASSYRREVAIRAYATSFGRTVHWCALEDLGTLARDPAYEQNGRLAMAVARLYSSATARDVLEAVCRWADSEFPEQRAHADRCLVHLALHSDHAQDGLRRLLLEAGLPYESLARLWRSALLRPWTAADAWYALEYWLHCVDGEPDVAESVLALLSQVVVGQSLRRRFSFYILQWRSRMPESRLLDRLDMFVRSSNGG